MKFRVFFRKSLCLTLAAALLLLPQIGMAGEIQSELKSKLDQAKARFTELMVTYGPSDSKTIKIQETIKELKSKLENLSDNLLGSAQEASLPASDPETALSDASEMGPTWKADMILANYCLASGDLLSAQVLFQMAYSKAQALGVSTSDAKNYAAQASIIFDGMKSLPNTTSGSTSTTATTTTATTSATGSTTSASTNSSDTTWAQSFNSTRVIPDVVFTDYTSMSQEQVQNFLEKKGSVLSKPYNGQYPSDMIMSACQKYGISPKVILATLQKEQGLISKSSVPTSKLDWALGVGCYDSGDWNTKYKGLDKQIEYAAATYKNRYDEAVKMQKEGKALTMKVDGKTITCANASTWALYRYTPHFQGSELFFKVYKGYFI